MTDRRATDEAMTEAGAPGRTTGLGSGLETVFRSERPYLMGVLYRLTGSTADAEDLVQSTFERALARPPADTTRPWRPWLLRVAVNLGRDHLRRRRRREYDGPWLPSPLETTPGALPFGAVASAGTEARYELLESVSFAFLLALEGLTPTQRAVLLLRDVFEYDGRETATLLSVSEASARQHLRRARRAMAAYEASRGPGGGDEGGAGELDRQTTRATSAILERFLVAIAQQDLDAVAALLAEDVVLQTDAGGEYHAARLPVVGRAKVARFYLNIARQSGTPQASIRQLNGQPGVVVEIPDPKPGVSPRIVSVLTFDEAGRVARIDSVSASRKIQGLGLGLGWQGEESDRDIGTM